VEGGAVACAAGRRTLVRGHGDGEFEVRHDINHLAAITPAVKDLFVRDLPREPAIAIAIAIAIGSGAPLAVVTAFVVVAAPFVLLPVWFIVRDTTHTVHQRVSVMLRTFDGRPHLVVANHLYKLDPAAICEIAAELGYIYLQTGTVIPTPWVMLSSTEHWMHFVLAPQPPVS
jgi:hypothetical protein